MPGTISVGLSIQHAFGVLKVPFEPGTITIAQTTKAVYSAVVSIGTSDTTLTFTGITTNGLCAFYNLDPTNYVQWGPDSTTMVACGRLKALDPPACFRLDSGATIKMKANTAACLVQVVVYAE